MSKKKSIISKFSEGNSDETIQLVEIGNVKLVKKSWKDKIRGSEAIKKQILFEEIISGQVRIKTPKVIDTYLDNEENVGTNADTVSRKKINKILLINVNDPNITINPVIFVVLSSKPYPKSIIICLISLKI